MRVFDAPSPRDASTNSRSRSDSTSPRTIRAMYVQVANAIRKMITPMPGLERARRCSRCTAHAAPIPRPSSRIGIESTTSTRAGQQRVHPAAVEARDQADVTPMTSHIAVPMIPDLERDPRAVDDARGDVLAELVDAERMRAARAERRAERLGQVGFCDVRARQPEDLDHQRRERSPRRSAADQTPPETTATRSLAKAPPEQLQRRARGDVAARSTRPRLGRRACLSRGEAHPWRRLAHLAMLPLPFMRCLDSSSGSTRSTDPACHLPEILGGG